MTALAARKVPPPPVVQEGINPQHLARGLAVCDRVAAGSSLRKAAKAEQVDPSSVLAWCQKDSRLEDAYRAALHLRADLKFDQIRAMASQGKRLVEECDDAKKAGALVQALRVRIDTEKWVLARESPKRYSERFDGLDVPGAPGQGLTLIFFGQEIHL